MQENYREAVYELVRLIPPGSVLSYGDIAEILSEWPEFSGGPRQVAKIMATSNAQLPWWRVVRANGTLPPDLAEIARPHWESEATPVREEGVRMKVARWNPAEADFEVIERALMF